MCAWRGAGRDGWGGWVGAGKMRVCMPPPSPLYVDGGESTNPLLTLTPR